MSHLSKNVLVAGRSEFSWYMLIWPCYFLMCLNSSFRKQSLPWAPSMPPTLWQPGPSPRTSRLPHDPASKWVNPQTEGVTRTHSRVVPQLITQCLGLPCSLLNFGASPLEGKSAFLPGLELGCRTSPPPPRGRPAGWPSNCQLGRERPL